MARKIRFGLNMPEKQNIRTIEELKQYFDLKTVLEYYFNNKLNEWLTDRGYNDIAEKINLLDREEDDFEENICKIFGAQQVIKATDAVTAEDVEELVERKAEIRKYTDDINVLENASNVVFNQKELDALVKDDKNITVYLIGKEFTLSCKYKNKNYVGLNNPFVKFKDVPEVALEELNIKLAGINVIDATIKIAKKVVKKDDDKKEDSDKKDDVQNGLSEGYKMGFGVGAVRALDVVNQAANGIFAAFNGHLKPENVKPIEVISEEEAIKIYRRIRKE